MSSLPDGLRDVDSRFVNDSYWLLFPFHLVWDEEAKVSADGMETELPLGGGKAYKVTVRYPEEGGYTPGDVYELYVNEDYIIKQWIYRRGGGEEPTRVSTWEHPKHFGPLRFSLDHRGESEDFRVWFTDVAVSLSK